MDLLKATYQISRLDMSQNETYIKESILDIFSNTLGYGHSVFWSAHPDQTLAEPIFQQLDAHTLSQYVNHFYQYDPLHPNNAKTDQSIQLMTQQNTLPTEQLHYYKADFLAPQQYMDEMAIYLKHNGSLIGVIGLLKKKGQSPFGTQDILQLHYLKQLIENQLLLHRFLQKPSPYYSFTNREIDILEAVCQGKRNKEIAAELFISENTVKKHLQNLYIKCGVDNKTALAMVYRSGL